MRRGSRILPAHMRAILALEDGRTFIGESFGAAGSSVGEVCFNTSMTGYQEVLTDPSYRGQIVAMTAPQIGNTGINDLDDESTQVHVRGYIIEELSPITSNWRATGTLDDFLKKWNVPGIQGIDTRALTKHLRSRGAMQGCLTTGDISPEQAVERAKQAPPMAGSDFVKEVTPRAAFDWDPDDTQSPAWTIVKGDGDGIEIRDGHEVFKTLPPARHSIVAYDFGMKRNILRRLRQEGFKVRVVPADTSAADVLALKPDGVFLSNGPGDPAALTYVHENIRQLIGKTPNAIGYSGMGYANASVKMLNVAKKKGDPYVHPSIASTHDKTYQKSNPIELVFRCCRIGEETDHDPDGDHHHEGSLVAVAAG